MTEPIKALRKLALQYPEAVEAVACAGTPAERGTIRARAKAFLFFGADDLMVKLGPSLPRATELAGKDPARFKVGAHAWVTVTFTDGPPPPIKLLEAWVDESYRLIANKQLVAMLPAPPPAASKKAAGKRPSRSP